MSQSCHCQCLAYHLHAHTLGVYGDLTLGLDGYIMATALLGGCRMVTEWLQNGNNCVA